MSDERAPIHGAERAAELLPALTERLRRHGLGEIEVREGDFRLRVAGMPALTGEDVSAPPGVGAATPGAQPEDAPPEPAEARADGVRAPAVGFFIYADGLGPGLAVDEGDALGHVEMLGVRHEVRAPRPGTVRHLVAETGEAVEYGQVLIEIEAGRGLGS